MVNVDIAKAAGTALGQDEGQAKKIMDAFASLALKELAQGNSISLFETGMLVPQAASQTARILKWSDIIGQLAEATDTSRDVLDRYKTAFLEQTRSVLFQGGAAEFARLGTVRVQTIRAKIQKDEKRGVRLLSQPCRNVVFSPAEPQASESAPPTFAFQAEAAFAASLDISGATIMLVFPEVDWFAKTVDFHFRQAGWKTLLSHSVSDAMQKLEAGATHLVMIDAEVKGYQQLCEAVKCQRELNPIPLIILFPKDFNLDLPAEFMICGDEHVVQPFEVKKLLSIADAELARFLEEESVFDQQVLFMFPTDDIFVERANALAHKLLEGSGLREEDVDKLSAAIREAISNACQHGNRYRRDKKVECLYLLDKEKVTVMIKDQGHGFDHEKYVRHGRVDDSLRTARERLKEGKLGGLGITLMLRCTDKLEYNDLGNSITLTKFLR